MKVFQKISASRSKVDDKSVRVDDLFFNKKKIFAKDEINEVIDFLKGKCVNDIMCKPITANMIAHHFNNNLSVSRRFMFVCASLVDKKGQSLFNLYDDEGMTFLEIKKVGVLGVGEDKQKPAEKVEEPKEEKKEEPETKPEDINKDGKVDEKDLSAVHKEYSKENADKKEEEKPEEKVEEKKEEKKSTSKKSTKKSAKKSTKSKKGKKK